MDLITQAVLGAAVAEAGWRKELGRGAILAGALWGMLPDADVLSNAFLGEWASIAHHRGFTHSLFFAPLVAPLLGLLAWRLSGRRGTPARWATLAFWAVITHPLLDVFTPYGTQLLSPLTDRRFALDAVSVIDPLYTVPLLLALLGAWIWRRAPERGRKLAATALAATTIYLGAGWLHSHALEVHAHEQLAASGHDDVVEVRAMPTMGNTMLHRVVARHASGDLHIALHSRLDDGPIRFELLPHVDAPALEVVHRDDRARLFRWMAMGMLSHEVTRRDGVTIVRGWDQRYARVTSPTSSLWGFEARVSEDGQLESIRRVDGHGPFDARAELGEIWRRVWLEDRGGLRAECVASAR